MKNILITGATGNIGFEVIRFLYQTNTQDKMIAGVRDIDKAKQMFAKFPKLNFEKFDFENTDTFDTSFANIDVVFLLRPPHISDTEKYFRPLIRKIKECGITKIVFLSVQGAEKSSIIPHNKIEKLIIEFGFEYIFIRPSYFMQNLTTTLLKDILDKRKIILPAGKAKFNWVDVENIGEATAVLLTQFDQYKNRAIEITGYENENFNTVKDLINLSITDKIKYDNVNPIHYYRIKKKEGISTGLILVMIMLHFLPRFQKEPQVSDMYKRLTGKNPTSLKEFIDRENKKFSSGVRILKNK